MQNVRLADLCIRVALGVLAFVSGAWFSLGRIVAEKTATTLVMPCGIIWLLLFVAVLAARRVGHRDLLLAAAVPFSVLSILGNGFVAEYLARTVEHPYMDIDPLKEDPFDAVVLLGGDTVTGGNGRIQGNTSGDRVLLTAQLYHRGIARMLICCGSRIVQLDPDRMNASEEAKRLLVSLGVPAEAIETQEGRNTSEEMSLLGKRYAESNHRVGLVTSAWHLPRAMRRAKSNGFRPSPLPADFITELRPDLTAGKIVLDCIPQELALWKSALLIREYLATFVGR